ncbi:unnamed protein product [Aphanomyces euteiches]
MSCGLWHFDARLLQDQKLVGAQWGENGYIYLQRGVGGNGMCNVVEYISYPTLTGTSVNAPSTSQPTVPPTTSAPTVKPTTAPTFSPTTKPSTTGTSQTTTAPTAKPTSNPSPGGAAAYAQCGGNNFSGPTSCVQGFACKFYSEWYSQCIPQ